MTEHQAIEPIPVSKEYVDNTADIKRGIKDFQVVCDDPSGKPIALTESGKWRDPSDIFNTIKFAAEFADNHNVMLNSKNCSITLTPSLATSYLKLATTNNITLAKLNNEIVTFDWQAIAQCAADPAQYSNGIAKILLAARDAGEQFLSNKISAATQAAGRGEFD